MASLDYRINIPCLSLALPEKLCIILDVLIDTSLFRRTILVQSFIFLFILALFLFRRILV